MSDNSQLFDFDAVYRPGAVDLQMKRNQISGGACNTVTGCVIAEHNWVAVPAAQVLDQAIAQNIKGELAEAFMPLSSQKAVSDAASETLPALAGAGKRVVMDAAQLVMTKLY